MSDASYSYAQTVARLVTRLCTHPDTANWPAGNHLASSLFAALVVAGPLDARHIVHWAWRHSDSPADHPTTRGQYKAGTNAKSSYLRRDAVRELIAAVIFFLRFEENRHGSVEDKNIVTSLHDALLGTYEVMDEERYTL